MKRKLILSVAIIAAILLFTCLGVAASGESAVVYVTIANGELLVAGEPVSVTDEDGDGTLTINDALIAAHKQLYSGGVEGYKTASTDLGMYIERLWGIENGGSYGYYLNDAMVMGLTTPIQSGYRVTAYAYTDAAGFSDVYTFFNEPQYNAKSGEKHVLLLNAIVFDENFNPVSKPLAGAAITVDGKPTEFKTDANGYVEIGISDAGRHVISAVSDTTRIVPPVCIAEIGAGAPKTGDAAALAAVFATLASAVTLVLKKKNEKR